jgi:hypothetical protein
MCGWVNKGPNQNTKITDTYFFSKAKVEAGRLVNSGMAQHRILWQHFPKHSACSNFLRSVVSAFEDVADEIASQDNVGQISNDALAKVRPGLEQLGFIVESSKKTEGKIKVPVLYGPNGKVEKAFEADAYHEIEKTVIEVEAGRGVTNYQFLKDLFQACVMQNVDFLVIAIRQDYRGSDDYQKVISFIETIYASNRLILPLRGVVIVGY